MIRTLKERVKLLKGSLKKKGSNFYGEFRVTNPEEYSCGQPVDIDVSLVGKKGGKK